MENSKIKTLELFTVIAVITFLTTTSLCYSQSVFDAKEKEDEIKIQNIETFYGLNDSKQIIDTGKNEPEDPSTVKKDSTKDTKDEKIVKKNDTAKTEDAKIKSYDSTRFNMFGNLLRDDTVYNKKYSLYPLTRQQYELITDIPVCWYICRSDVLIHGKNLNAF